MQSSAKPHLFWFSFSLGPVYFFETFSDLPGRQICYVVTWRRVVDGSEWIESMHLPLNKRCFNCGCLYMCMLLPFNDFLPSLTNLLNATFTTGLTCLLQGWGLIMSDEGCQLSLPEARGTGKNGNWTIVLYTPYSVMDGLQQETNQRNQKDMVSC